MYGAGFDGEGDGFGLLAAAGAHQAGGPARLPAGGAVPAPMQAHGQPEVVILQATEVGGDSCSSKAPPPRPASRDTKNTEFTGGEEINYVPSLQYVTHT